MSEILPAATGGGQPSVSELEAQLVRARALAGDAQTAGLDGATVKAIQDVVKAAFADMLSRTGLALPTVPVIPDQTWLRLKVRGERICSDCGKRHTLWRQQSGAVRAACSTPDCPQQSLPAQELVD